ncbi:PREDICTED: uncharacterized protein LOC106815382 isoform X2 [Priapulus caudatus]|nr:PREDICTED: uncharacterized protein LOC106815382 isoform X2 [Priapulus caudatus]
MGLRFANKLSKTHLNFHQQKMKVSLAVQTFSSSVAKALEIGRILGFPQCDGSEATCKFIKEDGLLRYDCQHPQSHGLGA